MPTNTATKPTRIAIGSVRAGHSVRLANRARTGLSPAYVSVTDVEPKDIAEGKPGYRIITADGEYGHFPASAKFELMPDAVAKAEVTPKQVVKTKSKGPRVSPSLKRCIGKLVTPEGKRGELTRADLHEDPMVLVAAERRDWITVDRTGDERKTDLITLTEDGFLAAKQMGVVVESANSDDEDDDDSDE